VFRINASFSELFYFSRTTGPLITFGEFFRILQNDWNGTGELRGVSEEKGWPALSGTADWIAVKKP